jgi:hypothetical protein
MRLVVVMLLAGLVALPLSASAQEVEEGASPELSAEEPAPSTEPAPEEPALQLKLDDAGVGVVPSPPRTVDGYTLEEMERRVKRARTGLIVTSLILGVGVALWVAGEVHSARNPPPPDAFSLGIPDGYFVAGMTLTVVGSTGMIVSAAVLGVRKRKLRKLQEAHYRTPRRVQWDLARSRLVF